MEYINSTSPAPGMREDIISENALWILAVTVRVCLNTIFSVSAFITNIINFIIFKRMNINSAAKESFLILSFADGFVGLIGTIAGVCNGLRYLASGQVQGSMYALYILLLAVATVPSMTSLLSTTVLAVVRCCSVVLPLRVKTLFTARRQRIFILSATAILIGATSYALTGTKINIAPNPNTNVSQLQLMFHPEYVQRCRYPDIYRGLVFYLSFFAVNICLFFMIIALKRSSRFRNRLQPGKEKNRADSRGGSNRSSQNSKASRREVQVIKVVILVSAMFIVCNAPAMVASILRQTVPGLNNVGTYRLSYDVLMIFVEAFLLLNCTLNIVVYLNFNTLYRTTFLEIFGKKRGK
ncbi:chemosensory receptor c [Plakobranchus ocellatus]|uniref:Chemosensory receptor c n=1 Tax=Plakobranchus ocellatus TaxID=259542 RepID=A0AAV4AWA6_9GAST|nr:chemosensory receptor c [Plakobranchus ocellatus]